jgi:pyridoxal phosphate enzyme (YggS family)
MIRDNVGRLLKELPAGVELMAAAKTRSAEEIREAVEAGVGIIGENYVQEAERVQAAVGHKARWHFIGHLQKNKVKKAVRIFDMIETVDSIVLAEEIGRRCREAGRDMEVLVEVNSGREPQKFGVFPEEAEELIDKIGVLSGVKVMGVMTMGPFSGDPENARSYFRTARELFEKIRASNPPGVEMKYLSMGMSATYRVAVEEGANIVRIGTGIFGPREYK